MYLNLLVSPVDPLRVVRHAIRVRECLNAHLDLTGDIKNAITAVQVVRYDWLVVVCRRVGENAVVPVLQVRLVLDELGERVPLILGGNETRAVGANLGRRRVRRLEGIGGPAEA